MTVQCSRFQTAILGSGCVGKTSIMERYFNDDYCETYKETVEETYIQSYIINGRRHSIHYIDTAGNIQFPAMKRVYISTANAFILVYSITDAQSFDEMKSLWEQIKATRKNVLKIPCVVVGNFLDSENRREIETFDALNWACSENLGTCFLEVSAKQGKTVGDIFNMLLEQLDNTRSEQIGPFRIRSTSVSRRSYDTEKQKKKLPTKMKFLRNKMSSVSECSEENTFKDYKETCIYKLPSVHNKMTIFRNGMRQEKGRSCSLPTAPSSITDSYGDSSTVTDYFEDIDNMQTKELSRSEGNVLEIKDRYMSNTRVDNVNREKNNKMLILHKIVSGLRNKNRN